MEDKGKSGVPPLISAIQHSQLSCAEMLLDMGADVDARDVHQDTALHAACRLTDTELGVEALQMLLSKGAEKTCVNMKGQTPLMLAFSTTNMKAAEVLGGRPRMMQHRVGESTFDECESTVGPLEPSNILTSSASMLSALTSATD